MKQNFDKAATSYDRLAVLQQTIADELLKLCPEKSKKILELGCGTGNLTAKLEEKYPQGKIWAVDYSEEMLKLAKTKCTRTKFILADIRDEKFWTGLEDFDLVVSNATLQWCKNIDDILFWIYSHLREDSYAVFSLFGPGTFKELSIVFGKRLPAQGFKELEDIKLSCQRWFDVVKFEIKLIQRQYLSLLQVLKVIKHTGTRGTAGMFLIPSQLRRYEDIYRKLFGTIRVSYEVAIAVVKKTERREDGKATILGWAI